MLGVDVHQVPVIKNQVGDLHGKQYRRCLVSELQEPRRIQCVNSSSFPSPKQPATGPTWTPYKYKDSDQLRPFHEPPRPPRKGNPSPLSSSSCCKRNTSQKEVLHVNHPTIQVLADIFARARPKKNESVGVVRPVDRACMVCVLSTQNN